jgi:hypothetical protein
MGEIRKALHEITREEWIGIRWIETNEFGEDERTFVASGLRTPDEAREAMEDWDVTQTERHACYEKQKHIGGAEFTPVS